MGRRMRGGPGIGEMRRAVMRYIVLVDTVETHPAVLAVLVFNDHRHEG